MLVGKSIDLLDIIGQETLMTNSEPNAVTLNHLQRLFVNYSIETGLLQLPRGVLQYRFVGSL